MLFVLLRRMTLWPWPLTFWPFWPCLLYSASHVRPKYQFLLSYDYRILSYEYWIFDHISVIWNSHCACAASRDFKPRAKIVHIFEIPDPNLLCHCQGASTKIKLCYRQKIAFSPSEGYKVHRACAVSRDLCIGGPPKPHVTIFDPELPIHCKTFMGIRWRLRVVYIGASPC